MRKSLVRLRAVAGRLDGTPVDVLPNRINSVKRLTSQQERL